MPFEEDKGRSEVENLEAQIALVTKSLKLQKCTWEVERKELHQIIQSLRNEISWLRKRSLKHVLGVKLWWVFHNQKEQSMQRHREDDYF